MSQAKRGNIKFFTSWRGVAALAAFFIHNGYSDELCALGWSSMMFFFVMSGFLMMMHHDADDLRRRGLKNFWGRKLGKIYLIHWAALALLLLLMLWHRGNVGDWRALVPNVLLVHCYIPVREVFISYNGVTWFLSGIVLCYVCYPLLLRYTGSASRWCVIAVTAVVYAVVAYKADARQGVYLYVFPPLRLVEFMLGMEAYKLYERLRGHDLWSKPVTGVVADAAIVLGYGLLLWYGWRGGCPENYQYSLLWWPYMTAVVVTAACLSGHEGPLGRLATSMPLMLLGEMSLEVFLFHGPIAVIVAYFVIPPVNKLGGGFFDPYLLDLPVLAWVYLLPVLAGSWYVHKKFTKRIDARLKQVFG